MQMSAGIKDVAQISGVSIATVSHVINGTRFVSEETKQKVEDAMRELRYVPNSIARSLRTNKSRTVGLLVPDISNFYFTDIAESIESVLREHGYNLLLCNTGENLSIEKKQIAVMNSQLVSGMIIAPTDGTFDYRSLMAEAYFPMVMIDRRPSTLQSDTVTIDGCSAMSEAVEHLLEKKHKRIAYITGREGISTTVDRLNDFREALSTRGIEVDPSLIRYGDSSLRSGYPLMEQLLDETEATAVVISNNMMTVSAMRCLIDRHIDIPGGMAVIGFDDYNWATITNPPLSMIRQPTSEIGIRAAELILERIEKQKGKYREYRLPARFILRESC